MSDAMPIDLKYPELTGVSEAILLEDFMVTARALGGPYCRAKIPSLGWNTGRFPAIYVPFQALTFALKKGDTVLVKFQQDDIRYPYVWFQPTTGSSVPYPTPTDDCPQPGTKDVAFPSQDKHDYSFQVLGNGLIVASNEAYACVRFGTTAQYFWADGQTMYSEGNLAFQGAEIHLNGSTKHLITKEGLDQLINGPTGLLSQILLSLTTTPIAGNGAVQPSWANFPTSLDLTSAQTETVKTK